MPHADVCIAGAGIIGLSLALELHHRGAHVLVLDQGEPLSEASTAAAGMLAASDPDNPLRLRGLSDLSLSLYPSFLDRIASLSGIDVPLHTSTTLQALPQHLLDTIPAADTLSPQTLSLLLPQLVPGERRFILLPEHSLDPRELAVALLRAVRATTIDLRPRIAIHHLSATSGIEVHTSAGVFSSSLFVDCTGAWSLTSHLLPHLRVTPRKGQMLSVALPPSFPLHLVVRTPEVYVVPRTQGPAALRAIIGATVEDAGYDKTVYPEAITRLRDHAAALLPPLAEAGQIETWAGLRPATQDTLPILGSIPGRPNHFLATGHYRNGILLAPATAHVMAQLLNRESPSIDLVPFSPERNPTPGNKAY
ncbi:NAD(P)/FAD-dependent oxidoreductase [Edaphobacter bradus]|uniref:NAD(P)/FAD-dependent oxidoreductase n=1 Tax=Edaphobacter bradus TaxID=2259016 RepID=UPI0021E022A6|nr:FAD-dependent oxidoreductase [Edaphobacter bradus]